MSVSRDRRAKLLEQSALNGIDFVEVLNADATRLRVHFLTKSPVGADRVTAAIITGGDAIPTVAATLERWDTTASGYPTLDILVAAPGDFSAYTLRLVTNGQTLDRFFDHVAFSFKANCPSTLDCRQPAAECSLPANNAPPIDYLAKDFDSFRKALFEFSALRYPAWQERSEADFGVMFIEALASVADDLSYQQDRIAAEAWIETATQRRSLVRLARMVDYEPRVAVAASVLLQFEMSGSAMIPAGLAVSTLAPDGQYIDFETGTGLADTATRAVDPSWNRMQPYWWDDNQRCLPAGATEMWIERPSRFLEAGQLLVIDTAAEPAADPPLREIVQLSHVDNDETDPLYGMALSRIVWRAEDALRAQHDLTRTTVAGNLVPATHGRRCIDNFVVSSQWSPGPAPPRAIVRIGANGTLQFLHSLRNAPLAWLAQDDTSEDPRPEIRVLEWSTGEGRRWEWRRSLLDADELEEAITIDPVRYRTVDAAAGIVDYDGDDGATLRFGDGVFGAIPGDNMAFEVSYRCGGGLRGNVAAGTIFRLDHTHPVTSGIISVTNPLPASGGRDKEPDDQVREMAPQRFRATQYRAVRTEDYEHAAMTLPWVQRAGTQFRYTGSWLSVFTTVDPRGTELLTDDRLVTLTNLLDRYRLAGYETFGLAPLFAALDIEVIVCARPDAFRADVKRAVLTRLAAAPLADGSLGFFHPDRFTFGVALRRSALEAALQEVTGVDGVVELSYRRRGRNAGLIPMPDSVEVARDEIVQVNNDPSRPERGSLRVEVRGGK